MRGARVVVLHVLLIRYRSLHTAKESNGIFLFIVSSAS